MMHDVPNRNIFYKEHIASVNLLKGIIHYICLHLQSVYVMTEVTECGLQPLMICMSPCAAGVLPGKMDSSLLF